MEERDIDTKMKNVYLLLVIWCHVDLTVVKYNGVCLLYWCWKV